MSKRVRQLGMPPSIATLCRWIGNSSSIRLSSVRTRGGGGGVGVGSGPDEVLAVELLLLVPQPNMVACGGVWQVKEQISR